MNKKILTAALLGGLAFAQAASAQEFDDRWYLPVRPASTSRTATV